MVHPSFHYPQTAVGSKRAQAALMGSYVGSRDDMCAHGGLLGGTMIMIQQTIMPTLSHRAAPHAAFTPH